MCIGIWDLIAARARRGEEAPDTDPDPKTTTQTDNGEQMPPDPETARKDSSSSELASPNPPTKPPHHQDDPTTKKTPPTFLSLPPELRNDIYRHLLLNQWPCQVCSPYFYVPELLFVSRQVQDECLGIFFGENDFYACRKCIEMREEVKWVDEEIRKASDWVRPHSLTRSQFPPATTHQTLDKMAATDHKSPSESSTKPTAKKTLFDLPAELRIDIYRLILIEPVMPSICARQFRLPALLQVNQQTRNEAWSIYYGENSFRRCEICGRNSLIQAVERRVKDAEGKAIAVKRLSND
ncbi:hypothetical protein PRZ48_010889 [Zasmidium cellare]|uniref:F-box domain-containing protein n=1 Tax=Zasmidium cellare TaxID=395010 RepID=A0ABR0E9X1_ZASCE|nr:hypothetical protein PRZ48_010889 [Zasmidium cellare]